MLRATRSAALVLVLGAGLSGAVRAQTTDDLHITRRSTFAPPANARDPLLPIGWQPAQGGPVTSAGNALTVESFLVPSAFVISSISLDRIPLAVINGKAYGEGDTLPFLAGGEKIQLQVFAIRDGTVTLRYKAFQVVCPIRTGQPAKPASATP